MIHAFRPCLFFRGALIAAAAMLLLQQQSEAQPRQIDRDDAFQTLSDPGFRVIPLSEAQKIVGERFRGRLIAARLMPPTKPEERRGVELVHELRLLTRARNVLLIRLDARTGAFLEVAGAGLTEARRRNGDSE